MIALIHTFHQQNLRKYVLASARRTSSQPTVRRGKSQTRQKCPQRCRSNTARGLQFEAVRQFWRRGYHSLCLPSSSPFLPSSLGKTYRLFPLLVFRIPEVAEKRRKRRAVTRRRGPRCRDCRPSRRFVAPTSRLNACAQIPADFISRASRSNLDY